jgi:hypothetical protein
MIILTFNWQISDKIPWEYTTGLNKIRKEPVYPVRKMNEL